MKRNIRIRLYLIGIILLLAEIQFHLLELITRTIDRMAIRRVQYIAQVKNEEFKHFWLGIGVIQYPSDLITYSDLLYGVKPEVIIETGTNYGGLTVYLATLLEKIRPDGKVITIDIDNERWEETVASGKIPKDLEQRIVFIKGDSVSKQVLDAVTSRAKDKKGMVILDSLHSRDHVFKELELYSKFVALNSYIIVNDTHLETMGIMGAGDGNGPLTAVKRFLETTHEFQVDDRLPGTLLSCAPSGFLRRTK